MINKLMRKYGVLKTTIILSVLCVVVSESIAAITWRLAGLPNLGFLLFVAFLCPAVISPIVIISLCRLSENLQKSEERYRSLFENANDLIQVVQPDGQFLYVNPSWCNAMGYTKEEALSLKIFDIIHPESAEQCKLHFGRTLAEGSSGIIEPVFQRKDGEKVILHGSGSCKYKNGQPEFVHCIFHNVTEKRYLEEELVKMQRLESVGILAGGIAHDFNNILTSILGNLSLARTLSESKGKSYKKIEDAEKATLRAQELTQQLLTFSKGGDPIKVTTSISEIIKDSCQFVLRGSNVKCIFDLEKELSLVDVDEGQISQVIYNLLINADQAIPDGGLINIRAKNVRINSENDLPLEDGSYVLITVEDHGSGISEMHLNKIFDPYFSTKHEGHGLGLATAYSIIKKHGGHITADSKLGEGSVFRFYLPASTKTKATLALAQPKEDLYYGKGSVLLMDDEEHVRAVGEEMLDHLGYEVSTATDGKQVIEMYTKAYEKNAPFDVVVLDLTVPGGLGGQETLGKLVKIDPSIKAIVSSGYANDPVMANYKQYGFSAVMSKPYKIEYISKVLHDVFDSK